MKFIPKQRLITGDRFRIPDDCIDFKRHSLFMARKAMAKLVVELKASKKHAA